MVFFLLVFKRRTFSRPVCFLVNNTTNSDLLQTTTCTQATFAWAKNHQFFHAESLDKNVQDDAYTKYDELSEIPSKRTPQSTPRDTHKQRRDDDVEWQLYDVHSSAFGNVRVVVLV